ncbi:MAG: LysM peptidoglycan-binding domain-containing protein [Xanthomonadaceae bacterium]|jgi:hypothetical protein|nr:LysM peptidoglycan-binding domain-containing protein [Xanthomonadaceae bacterium]
MLIRLRTVVAAALLTVAAFATAVDLAGGHPDTYVVRKGDTLWDIAGRFLQKPWLWPEIWQANPQIANPHLIYPGDVLSLAYLNRAPAVTSTPGPRTEAPINTIPLSAIEPFLRDLRVTDSFEHLPYVVGLEDSALRVSAGQLVYIRGLSAAAPGQRYMVVRPTSRFTEVDPATIRKVATTHDRIHYSDELDFRGRHVDGVEHWTARPIWVRNKETLGYELARVNVGTVTRVGGAGGDADLVTLSLEESGREVRAGDRVLPVETQPYDLHFTPHVPRQEQEYSKLQILAVADGFLFGGTHDVVAVSGGAREGIDNGTVFSVWRTGERVVDRVRHGDYRDDNAQGDRRTRLPDEYASHIMIFRTFDKVSYGLVMDSTRRTRIGDEVKHPDAR